MFWRFTVSNSSLSNPFATFLFCCHSLFSAFYISQFSFYLFIYKSTKVVKMHVTYIILIIVISSNLFSDVSTSICTNSHESLTRSWIQIHPNVSGGLTKYCKLPAALPDTKIYPSDLYPAYTFSQYSIDMYITVYSRFTAHIIAYYLSGSFSLAIHIWDNCMRQWYVK